jgi:putative addiction module CopG family antidote
MTKTYTPGPEADVIVERQLAKGNYASADEVVRASLRLLEEHHPELDEAELKEQRRLIAEGDAAYARGDYTEYTSADELLSDIIRLGDAPSPPKG